PRETIANLRAELLPTSDFVLFLDQNLLILGVDGLEEAEAIDVAGSPVVTSCGGQASPAASLSRFGARDLSVIGCSPIVRGAQVTGIAVAGYLVDQELLEELAPPGARMAMFRETEPVPVARLGNFPGLATTDPMLPRSVLQEASEEFLDDEGAIEKQITAAGRGYFTALAPLTQANGDLIGVLAVLEPAAAVAETQRDVIRLIFLVTLAVVLLALLLALLAARRITGPVLTLTRAAKRVQSGDLAAKAEVAAVDEVGDLARAFNQMTDSVTEATGQLRASAEEEARLRDRLETVLNSMGDGLIAVDNDGAVVTYNPAAAQILGRPIDEVVGHPLSDVLRGRSNDGEPLVPDEELEAGLAFLRRLDGREVPVAISSSPLRGGSNAPLGRVYVLRDMTREREVERMKTEFLSNVSHELRTPLTPIIGYSEIMTRRGVPPERSQEFSTAILDSARRLERIVAMLVDFSAMEGGRMTIEAQPTPLHRVVRGAVEDWKKRADNHKFVTKVSPRLPQAMVDVSLVRRAVDELIDNAVKYSPSGGRIRVAVSSTNGGGGEMLKVDVADEGIGIDPDDLSEIFEDFRQVDASDTRMFGGLGLGLAFVRRIIEAHRGDIEVESEPGKGTTFSFTLPAADTSDGRSE
ncbi:MAG TPA: ATP-binding protein, partial [Actinomycetota bacterium]|nr:ATP-binding protein [Actinomycetota bacterium]